MANPIYSTLSKQSGLIQEMQVVANNIANISTSGFRSEGVVFAEHIRSLGVSQDSLSMAHAEARFTDMRQGVLTKTGGDFDLALEGPGFFQVETPSGIRLTRAGAFIPTAEGALVTPDGYPVLDGGGAPILVPADAGQVAIASDGTISANGDPIGQIGLFEVPDLTLLTREDGVRFLYEGEPEPAIDTIVFQGFIENSNVNPVSEIARMIEVQRSYEMGQAFLEREDDRLRSISQLFQR